MLISIKKSVQILFVFCVVTFNCAPVQAKLSVFWWNIGYNSYSVPACEFSTCDQTNLDKALSNIHIKNYDVIALGEFIKGTLHPESLVQLKYKYPYSIIVKYNDSYDKSIYLFSKTEITTKSALIDWVNPLWSEQVNDDYRLSTPRRYGSTKTFKRKYFRVRVNKENTDFNLIFYHFNNPWLGLKKNVGKYRTALEILTGTTNPLFNQILQLEYQLMKDLGDNYQSENTIIMGDSNCPRKIKGLTPVCYKKLKYILPIVLDKKKKATYPASSIKIDHVQASKHLKAQSKVLDLKGSDHLAIEVIIN